MRALFALLALLAAQASATLPAPGTPEAPADPRYCGEPARRADGSIRRSAAVLRQYATVWPCRVPGVPRGSTACPGFNLDHTIPLVKGGCDAVGNLAWMPVQIKSCAASTCKDRYEQKWFDPTTRQPIGAPAP